MKYELPEDLKRHFFPCDKAQGITTYWSCKRRCPDIYRQCWERHLREDLCCDCAVENERNARKFVTCSHCGAVCDIGLSFYRFLCNDCGNVEYCDSEEQKTLMGKDYIEIDEQELSDALKQVK